jgi:hypothetical protein
MAVEATDIYRSTCAAIRALAPRFVEGGVHPNPAVAGAIADMPDREVPAGVPMFLPPQSPPPPVAAYLLKAETMKLREVAKFVAKAGHGDLAETIIGTADVLDRALASS